MVNRRKGVRSMTTKIQRRLKQLNRERKETDQKMQSAMEAGNWREARSHHFWFHYLGDQIKKLREDAQ